MLSVGISLHDQDLQRLALKINAEHKLVDKFVACPTWVSRFKKYAGITSRRITTFTSTKNIKNKEKIAAAASKFVADLHDEVVTAYKKNRVSLLLKIILQMKNSPSKVFINCDQSGVNKEIHCPRTLAVPSAELVVSLIHIRASTIS